MSITTANGQAPAHLAEAYDEMVTGQGGIRRHWQGVLSLINALPNGLSERIDSARRVLDEDGATYNLYSDPRVASQKWSFDLLPVILEASEWSALEAGLAQRARLLNILLNDIYGPQKLLRDHLIPPALVFANPEFLRPCQDAEAKTDRPLLHHYAADLMRQPDGRWIVLSDRAQLAAGLGYALENRRVQARTLPEAFRGRNVHQLRPFFDLWLNALQSLAQAHRDNPHVALLSPGPDDEAYFEHVYLARELGLTLVEGADLTLRDGKVTLKTLEGLQPVDVLLRRVESTFCDPLELRADSAIGVVGMLQAIRRGNLVAANAIGSGVVETPALMPFLPGLSRALNNEELLLQSAELSWCGQARELDRALHDLPNTVIRRSFGTGIGPVIGAELDNKAQARLIAKIRARPVAFVAQAPVTPSVAPTWMPNGLTPHPIILRMFLVRHGDTYVAMPGGHARVPISRESYFRSPLQHRGITKDVWVMADEDADATVPANVGAGMRVAIQRGASVMPSRVADNLYWLGRYMERLDNGSRLLRAALWRLAQGTMGARDMVDLRTIAQSLDTFDLIDAAAAAAPPDSHMLANALTRATGADQPLLDVFRSIQRLAASTRDRLSMDMWQAVKQLLGEVRGRLEAGIGDIDRLIASFDDLIRFAAIFAGMASENMTRGAGWRFLDIGRRLERGVFVAQGAMGGFATAPVNWESAMRLALELCDSTITYRSRYLAALQPAPVLDLVLADDTNPRSLAFQLLRLDENLAELPRRPGELTILPVSQIVRDLSTVTSRFDTDERSLNRDSPTLAMLRDLLEETGNGLHDLSTAITRAYFTHVPAAQALGSARAATRI
ncbi:MAG: circularly permuted type 2 ATP-grasp protein [Rhodospirillales bacterium]